MKRDGAGGRGGGGLGGGGVEITQISDIFWCKISNYMYSINFKFLLEAKLDIEGGKMETGEMGEL